MDDSPPSRVFPGGRTFQGETPPPPKIAFATSKTDPAQSIKEYRSVEKHPKNSCWEKCKRCWDALFAKPRIEPSITNTVSS